MILYIKKSLLAIIDINEKSINFNNDFEFLKKKFIEENEKHFNIF